MFLPKIHEINKKYRGKDRPTDVISFAIEDGLDEDFMSAFSDDPDFVEDIGDLFLCPEVIKRHSVEYETGFNQGVWLYTSSWIPSLKWL